MKVSTLHCRMWVIQSPFECFTACKGSSFYIDNGHGIFFSCSLKLVQLGKFKVMHLL